MGSYLHLLLENLDFRGNVETQVLDHSAQIVPRFNLEYERWGLYWDDKIEVSFSMQIRYAPGRKLFAVG